MMLRRTALAVACLCLASGAWASDKDKKPKTLGSLSKQTVELPPDIPLENTEEEARENYRQYLEMQNADPARSAEAMRRLGDLELEAGESGALTRGDARLQASTYAPAIQRYQDLLKKFPNDPHNDVVLYQLARAQDSGGDSLAALATLDTLVARYPKTAQIDEVEFRRGEILFAHKRFEEAEAAYRVVLVGSDKSPYFEQSRYKLGWSLFRQDRFDDSVSTFFDVLDRRFAGQPVEAIDAAVTAMPIAQREVVDDSLRATSLCFSSQMGLSSLQQALQKRGSPAYGHLVYLSLASQYTEQKRWTDAAAVYAGYVAANPQSPRSEPMQRQAVAVLEEGKLPSQALAARADYVARFGLDQPYWKAQKQPPSAPSIAFLRESVWRVAQDHHAQAQSKTAAVADRQRDYAAAADGYRLYQKYFPKDARTPETQFLLGEALFESGDYGHAAEAYNASAYDYPAHAHSAEAGYAALLATQKQETQLSGDAAAALHKQRLDAGVKFATAFPTDKQASAARLDSAEGYLAGGASAEAAKAANAITASPTATAEQRRAAFVVLGHASIDAKDYARAENAYLAAWRLDLAAGRKDPELTEHLAAAIYRQGEQLRDAGKPQAAASAFLRVGQTVPTAKIVATSDFEAAQTYLAAKQPAAAIPVLQRFIQAHADSALIPQAQAKLALAYLDTRDEASAALAFETIANAKATPPDEAQEALQQSAKLYAAQKNEAGESRVLTQFIARYPTAFAATMEARQRLLEMAAAHDDAATVKKLCDQQIAADAGAGAQRSERSRWLAAHAALRLAEPTRAAFLADRLTQPLNVSLKKKKAHMETALAAYGKAADYGVADVLTESTFRLGELYQGLAKALYDSDRPKGLDAEARDQYDMILQEQAFPFEEKAIALYEANAKRARDGLYDTWVRNSYASLAVLVPAKYARPPRGAAPQLGRAALEAAVAKDPASAPAQFQLGQALAAEGAFEKADDAFEKAQAADAKFARAFYDRGVLNELYLGRTDEAVRNYEAFQGLQPEPDKQVAGWIDALKRKSAGTPPKGTGS